MTKPFEYSILNVRSCGEMDITTVFGTVVPGSSPGGSTTIEVTGEM